MKKTPGDIIILHLPTTNDNHMMYGSWDMVLNRQNLFSFWTILCPFTEKSKFWKKTPGDIISLHLCTINDNHMMYGSLDIRCNGQSFLWTIFFSLLTSFDIFCPFTPLTTPKNQNFEKLKKAPHHFKQEYQKLWSYAIPFLRYGSWWIYFSFFILSCFLPFSSTWRYHQITHVYQKFWSNTILFLRYSGWQK